MKHEKQKSVDLEAIFYNAISEKALINAGVYIGLELKNANIYIQEKRKGNHHDRI